MWGRGDETKNSGVRKSVWLFVRALTLRGSPEHTSSYCSTQQLPDRDPGLG